MIVISLVTPLIVSSFLGCSGGSSDSGGENPGGEDSIALSYPQERTNEIINEGETTTYELSNAKSGYDYYFKVKASDANLVNSTIKLDFFSGATAIQSNSVETSYTALVQVINNYANPLLLKMKGKSSTALYRYDLEVFQGLEEGLVQDDTSFEPNDYQEISYTIAPNIVYSTKVKALDDPRDWYVIKNAKKDMYYYFELSPNENNPTGVTQRNLYIEFFDEDGSVMTEQTAETGIAYTYQVKALRDGPLYSKINREIFNTGNGAGDTADYRYTLKSYATDDVVHDANSFEPNNYADIATDIALGNTYDSDVYGYSTRVGSSVLEAGNIDRYDYFVLSNVDASKQYRLNISSSADNISGITAQNFMIEAQDDSGAIGSKNTIHSGESKNIDLQPSVDGNLYVKFYGQYTKYNYKYTFTISEI